MMPYFATVSLPPKFGFWFTQKGFVLCFWTKANLLPEIWLNDFYTYSFLGYNMVYFSFSFLMFMAFVLAFSIAAYVVLKNLYVFLCFKNDKPIILM